jgi:predicted glycoside hydrolase/deacetylase ChbG (UPF0249 family)
MKRNSYASPGTGTSEVRLVVNADDLGLSAEINAGALWALENGYISDTSVLINAPCAGQAVEGLARLGIRHAGIHIDLDGVFGWSTGGREVHTREELAALLGQDGFMDACRDSARMQVRKFVSAGLTPSHVDTHHHVHRFPPVFLVLMELARDWHIPAVRFSRQGYSLTTRQPIPFDDAVYSHMQDLLEAHGLVYCPSYLEGSSRLEEVGSADTELVVHPARGRDPWRTAELEALVASAGRERLRAAGIRMVSFHELVSESRQRSCS